MTQLAFGINIFAKDDTKGTLRSALSGINSFARAATKPITIPIGIGRKGLGLLRDLNLGLRPLVQQFDNLIERGSGLDIVRKSFESLTGKSGAAARAMANQLVAAANGTIRLSKAMQIANRALGSGIGFRQLGIAIEFISKKAITTGKNAEAALDTVITGLSRGSVLFLDDFGILVDGVESVKRSFDSIKGIGAFESLTPSAQKAEIIRQAIAEMQQQMGRIGVSGRENIFIFQAIKNAIGNSVDRLFAMVAGSKQLRTALSTVRDLIEGFTKHLEGGGSISDLLFGKKGGKSGGLLGLAGAIFVDVGENIGRGILGGILKGLAALPGLFSQAFDFLKKKALETIKFLGPHVKEFFKPLTDALALLKETLTPVAEEASKKLSEGFNSAVNAVKKLLNIPDFITPRPTGRFATPTSQPATIFPPRGMFEGEGQISTGQLLDNIILRVIPAILAELFPAVFPSIKRDNLRRLEPEMAIGPGRVPGTMKGFFAHFFGSSALASVSSQSPSLKQNSPQSILAVLSQVFGKVKEFVNSIPSSARDAVSEGKKLIESLDALGDKVLEQVPKFDRLREQIDALFSDFPADAKKKPAVDPKTIPLTAAERRRKRARARRIDQEIALRERGGAGVRQRALRETAAEIAKRRKEGKQIRPSDERRIFKERFRRIVEEETRRLREERDKITGDLVDDFFARLSRETRRQKIRRIRGLRFDSDREEPVDPRKIFDDVLRRAGDARRRRIDFRPGVGDPRKLRPKDVRPPGEGDKAILDAAKKLERSAESQEQSAKESREDMRQLIGVANQAIAALTGAEARLAGAGGRAK